MKQWSIFIDIEGFGRTYEDGPQARLSLGALVESIYRIGSTSFAESPNRIFAHQVGDGFVIVSEFSADSVEEALSLTVVLMQQILMAGGVSKAAVSAGDFADISGCYPPIIEEQLKSGNTIPMGDGLMTIFPVMGTALINSHALASKMTGGLLLLERKLYTSLPGIRLNELPDFFVVDWIHSDLDRARDLLVLAGLEPHGIVQMESKLRSYLEKSHLSPQWRRNTEFYLNCPSST